MWHVVYMCLCKVWEARLLDDVWCRSAVDHLGMSVDTKRILEGNILEQQRYTSSLSVFPDNDTVVRTDLPFVAAGSFVALKFVDLSDVDPALLFDDEKSAKHARKGNSKSKLKYKIDSLISEGRQLENITQELSSLRSAYCKYLAGEDPSFPGSDTNNLLQRSRLAYSRKVPVPEVYWTAVGHILPKSSEFSPVAKPRRILAVAMESIKGVLIQCLRFVYQLSLQEGASQTCYSMLVSQKSGQQPS
eukprot:Lankesteria_metandrocarpae@DN9233_c0_g1_i1.p1